MGATAESRNSVLQNFLVGKEEHKAKENTTRETTASKVHRRRLASPFLACSARQIHADLPHHISKIQSAFENACVRDSRECNYIAAHAAYASTRCIHFFQILIGIKRLS